MIVLVGAMLVRNEEGRWLEKVLAQLKDLCDKTVVIDDASTDNTAKICAAAGAIVFYSDESLWGTNELAQRERLWELAALVGGDGSWILCLDADETLESMALISLPQMFQVAEQHQCDSLAFKLHDMWSETHYREDQWWNAHTRPWIMAIQYHQGREYVWRDQPLHCGRFPVNAASRCLYTPIKIQHWGWSRPGDRQAKYERYKRVDPEGKWGIPEQYESILDKNPHLVPWLEVLKVG